MPVHKNKDEPAAAARAEPTAVLELEGGWITLGSDITLREPHNDHYQSLHCRVTLAKISGRSTGKEK